MSELDVPAGYSHGEEDMWFGDAEGKATLTRLSIVPGRGSYAARQLSTIKSPILSPSSFESTNPWINPVDRPEVQGLPMRKLNGKRAKYNPRRHLTPDDYFESFRDVNDHSDEEVLPPKRPAILADLLHTAEVQQQQQQPADRTADHDRSMPGSAEKTASPTEPGSRRSLSRERYPRLTGVEFSNLTAIPTDYTVDPPRRACFNCWLQGHNRRTCPRPDLEDYCRNCGRMEVQVHNCPRCRRRYWEIQVSLVGSVQSSQPTTSRPSASPVHSARPIPAAVGRAQETTDPPATSVMDRLYPPLPQSAKLAPLPQPTCTTRWGSPVNRPPLQLGAPAVAPPPSYAEASRDWAHSRERRLGSGVNAPRRVEQSEARGGASSASVRCTHLEAIHIQAIPKHGPTRWTDNSSQPLPTNWRADVEDGYHPRDLEILRMAEEILWRVEGRRYPLPSVLYSGYGKI